MWDIVSRREKKKKKRIVRDLKSLYFRNTHEQYYNSSLSFRNTYFVDKEDCGFDCLNRKLPVILTFFSEIFHFSQYNHLQLCRTPTTLLSLGTQSHMNLIFFFRIWDWISWIWILNLGRKQVHDHVHWSINPLINKKKVMVPKCPMIRGEMNYRVLMMIANLISTTIK